MKSEPSMFFSPAFYWMESTMDFILYWLIVFLPIILLKIAIVRYRKMGKVRDSMFFTEAIGLPLTFLQPVVFFVALYKLDWLGMLITVWWGPGFLYVIYLVLRAKIEKRKVNWGNSGIYISWMCKLYYLAYVALAFAWDMPKLMFALSAWIASDQIEKSLASIDADRSRRTFHDFWLLRILYPGLLFIPFLYNLDWVYKTYGLVLFGVWLVGILYVVRQREFMNLPEDPSLLRNMLYFKKDKSG